MKKLLLLSVLLLTLAGCGMTNDEIIAEAKKCNDAGYKVEDFKNGFGDVFAIRCMLDEPFTNPQ